MKQRLDSGHRCAGASGPKFSWISRSILKLFIVYVRNKSHGMGVYFSASAPEALWKKRCRPSQATPPPYTPDCLIGSHRRSLIDTETMVAGARLADTGTSAAATAPSRRRPACGATRSVTVAVWLRAMEPAGSIGPVAGESDAWLRRYCRSRHGELRRGGIFHPPAPPCRFSHRQSIFQRMLVPEWPHPAGITSPLGRLLLHRHIAPGPVVQCNHQVERDRAHDRCQQRRHADQQQRRQHDRKIHRHL
jgi:hypothetical protein